MQIYMYTLMLYFMLRYIYIKYFTFEGIMISGYVFIFLIL